MGSGSEQAAYVTQRVPRCEARTWADPQRERQPGVSMSGGSWGAWPPPCQRPHAGQAQSGPWSRSGPSLRGLAVALHPKNAYTQAVLSLKTEVHEVKQHLREKAE